MNKRNQNHLGTVSEDIEDLLKTIEISYEIQFQSNELLHVRTFGQLCDHIISKINLQAKDDCTNQQAFYKLRTIIEQIKEQDGPMINTNTRLIDIFQRRSRRRDIREIENQLGINLKALRPKYFVTNSILLVFLGSIVEIFIDWRYGMASLALSILGIWIAIKTGKEFKDKTLGELTERMTQLNYIKSRKQIGTVNKKEIEAKIRGLFVDSLGLDAKEIDRDTIIV